MIDAKIARACYAAHEKYWVDRRPEMRRLRSAYLNRYWDKKESPDQVLIETSRAYEFIEGYVASLFARSPAVVIKGDIRGLGNPNKAKALANGFLSHIRQQLEDATRLALIYPASFLKLMPNENRDPFKRVTVAAVAPWNVIVDTDAHTWDAQKLVGHRYYLTLKEARSRFGNKKYSAHPLVRFLDQGIDDERGYSGRTRPGEDEIDPVFQYVEIVEWYDIEDNRFVVWSPDYKNGTRLLYDGLRLPAIEDAEVKERKYDAIPFVDAAGNPLAPIIPLYYSRIPDMPMRGYSALRRVYDQVQETNIIRSYQASMVRRAARQWVVESGVFDAEAMSKLAQGVDGEFIEVELSPGQALAGSILPVPHAPVPAELQSYIMQVMDDFQRGSVLAPFTRGESTRATATEITALAAYSSSEVGRLARERDSAIERCARVYIAMMTVYLDEDSQAIIIDGMPEMVSARDLDGDFTYYAQDMGATPVSEAVKKQEFFGALPTLIELGVPPDQILAELVRFLDLPQDFLSSVQGASSSPTQSSATTLPESSPTGVGPGGPSPEDVVRYLP